MVCTSDASNSFKVGSFFKETIVCGTSRMVCDSMSTHASLEKEKIVNDIFPGRNSKIKIAKPLQMDTPPRRPISLIFLSFSKITRQSIQWTQHILFNEN